MRIRNVKLKPSRPGEPTDVDFEAMDMPELQGVGYITVGEGMTAEIIIPDEDILKLILKKLRELEQLIQRRGM